MNWPVRFAAPLVWNCERKAVVYSGRPELLERQLNASIMSQPTRILSPIRLKDFDPDFHGGLDKDEAREKSLRHCQRIGELQELLHANASQALLILLQGMDTSGKDGV